MHKPLYILRAWILAGLFCYVVLPVQATEPLYSAQKLLYEAKVAELEALRDIKREQISKEYSDALSTLVERAREQGNLEAVLAGKAEIERFNKTRGFPEISHPLPPAWLGRTQAPYRKSLSTLDRSFLQAQEKHRQSYVDFLAELTKTLTRSKRIEEAHIVQKERIRIANDSLSHPSPVRALTTATRPASRPTAPTTMDGRAQEASLSNGLVFHYSFDQPFDENVPDLSPQANHAPAFNTRWVAYGYLGGCALFDQGNAYIKTPTRNLDLSKGLTLSAYFYVPAGSRITSHGLISNTAKSGAALNFSRPGRISMAVHSEGDYKRAQAIRKLVRNKWYHATGVYDGTQVKVFLNGKLIKTVPCPGPPTGNEHHFLIGASPAGDNGSGNHFGGKIDEAMCWNRALSDEEVALLFKPSPGQ